MNLLILEALLILILQFIWGEIAEDACGVHALCNCRNDATRGFEVDCSGRILRDIPKGIPPNVTFINVSSSGIEELHSDCLKGLSGLAAIDLSRNLLQQLPKELFAPTPRIKLIDLSENSLTDVPYGVFRALYFLQYLYLRHNKFVQFPNDMFTWPKSPIIELELAFNNIELISHKAFTGVEYISNLLLSKNKIQYLPGDLFQYTLVQNILDLADNDIESLPPHIFQWGKKRQTIVVLLLQRNAITYIAKETFLGLEHLETLCIFNNKILYLDDGAFSGMNAKNIYLFGNSITKIAGKPFSTIQSISEIHLYGNRIENISEDAILGLGNNTILYLSCDSLKRLPRINDLRMECVSPLFVPRIRLRSWTDPPIIPQFEYEGFNCTGTYTGFCSPCRRGTFGDRKSPGCEPCPRGGFYQDEIAQTSMIPGEISCKSCNKGTYVEEGMGISYEECRVCPGGTNKSIQAGFRACFCKTNYSRMDRFGPCYQCTEDGLNCSQDYKLLLPGYFWSWKFPTANISLYKKFVENLQTEARIIDSYTKYDGEVPNIFECGRSANCLNTDSVIEVQCAKGYKGWLCSNCEPGYYAILNTCLPCPSLEKLILEVGIVLSLIVFMCYVFFWQIQRQVHRGTHKRSIVDVAISRVKLLLGFYQVVGEMFASIHEINWTAPLLVIGTFISSLELNILRLFIRPRCFSDNLILTPQTRFIIAVCCPVVLVVLPVLIYQLTKIYLKIVSVFHDFPDYVSYLENLRSRLYAIVIILMFFSYPSLCSIIFELYPRACKTFYLDKDKHYDVTRLRSDLDVDCRDLAIYHFSAYIFTVIYIIAFPTTLLCLIGWHFEPFRSRIRLVKHIIFKSKQKTGSAMRDTCPTSLPVWLNFLCENYKQQFWFWEILELTRKVTQTMLITVFGWEDRLTVLMTTCIAVLFLLLHALCKPMKSSYEQHLQMISLAVIFLNVVVGSSNVPSDYEHSITVILIFLNVIVAFLVVGELFLVIAHHIKPIGKLKAVLKILFRRKSK